MSVRNIQIVFWGEYAALSSADLGTAIGDEAEAMDVLYDRIASSESTIGYLNQIYDNAQVELSEDNMESLTVRDYYDLCMVYGDPKPESFKAGVASLTIYAPSDDASAVGMMYVLKAKEEGEASFNEYLEELKRREA